MMHDGVDLTTIIIDMDDLRLAGICAPGARRWFKDDTHDLQMREIRRGEMTAARLVSTNDCHAWRVVNARIKRDREKGLIP